MADEISLANVIRLELSGTNWTARIGPRGLGLETRAYCGRAAVIRLLDRMDDANWPLDYGWTDRLE